MRISRIVLGIIVGATAATAAWSAAPLLSQPVAKTPPTPVASGRFEFEIVESFDSRYLGDTPGHVGRHGELGDVRPQAALGDAVFRGDEPIGHVTRLTWSRGTGSLEIEFDPEPKVRIAVGEVVWIQLGEAKKS